LTVEALRCWLGQRGLEPLPKRAKAQGSRDPARRKAVTDLWFAVARVHLPHPLCELGFGFCCAGVLSQMLCPGTDSHFRPEGVWTLEYFVYTAKKKLQCVKTPGEALSLRQEILPGLSGE